MSAGTLGSLTQVLQGAGRLEENGEGVRLVNGVTAGTSYTNAQLCDYTALRRTQFPWRAPVRLTIEARFSGAADEVRGTAGFGFWNDPVAWNTLRKPTLPRAVWFIHASNHSNMRLATEVAGNGWKAATVDTLSLPAPLLLPVMALLAPAMRSRPFFRRAWPYFERRLRVCERPVPVAMQRWARYDLEWGQEGVRFGVDGATILECAVVAAGRMGLVIWIDNQYLVATPGGHLRFGVVELAHEQWMEVRRLDVMECAPRRSFGA